MRVLVTGGTGFVGRRLVEALSARGDAVVALSRSVDSASAQALARLPGVQVRSWNGVDVESLLPLMDGVDGVVSLAGEPVIGRRWSDAQKARILDSRVRATRALAEAMRRSPRPPSVFVSASAIGFYGDRGDAEVDESTSAGSGFLADVCRQWEAAAGLAPPSVRTVMLRIGIVLGDAGGSLGKMALPFRLGLGGRLGSGRQWTSWIHLDDVVGLVLRALDDEQLRGPVNGTAPEPVTNAELTRVMGRVLHRPAVLPVPAAALRLMLGEAACVLLEGQRVVPRRALSAGYAFRFTSLEPALRAIFG